MRETNLGREVLYELQRAQVNFPPFNSPHEGWAVIKEELDELWADVMTNQGRGPNARKEAIQIAAMGMRYVLDISEATDD